MEISRIISYLKMGYTIEDIARIDGKKYRSIYNIINKNIDLVLDELIDESHEIRIRDHIIDGDNVKYVVLKMPELSVSLIRLAYYHFRKEGHVPEEEKEKVSLVCDKCNQKYKAPIGTKCPYCYPAKKRKK